MEQIARLSQIDSHNILKKKEESNRSLYFCKKIKKDVCNKQWFFFLSGYLYTILKSETSFVLDLWLLLPINTLSRDRTCILTFTGIQQRLSINKGIFICFFKSIFFQCFNILVSKIKNKSKRNYLKKIYGTAILKVLQDVDFGSRVSDL